MTISYNTSIVRNGLALYIDAANVKSYPGTGTTWSDITGNGYDFTLVNPTYYSYDNANNGSFDFNRTLPPDAEDSAYATATGSGPLTALTYLGNNHTTEVWCKINNRSGTNYSAPETRSALFVYRGFHAMFYYDSNQMFYTIWGDNGSGGWTSNAGSFSDTSTGIWQQIVGVRENNSIKVYLNSVLQNTVPITVDSSSTPTSNQINISSASIGTSDYNWNADVNVSIAKMYTRTLSESEIKQNFEAHRGRYGI